VTTLLEQACGFRHGMVPPVQEIEGTFADVPGVYNACIVGDTGSTNEASSGGFARDRKGARCAAIAEALERYSARMSRFPTVSEAPRLIRAEDFALFSPEQRAAPGFPWPVTRGRYAEVFSLDDNQSWWVPEELVGLGSRGDRPTLPSTSNGLAAHSDPMSALLRATEELLERDALAVSWLSSLGGHELALDARYTREVSARGGEVACFELTQAWNPHPVVAVCGFLPLRGRKRFSLGAACRQDHARALDKAWLEWLQGVVFAGFYANEHQELRFERGSDVRDFPEHGVYYTLRPELWPRLPIFRKRRPPRPLPERTVEDAAPVALDRLRRALSSAGVRLFYRDLTLPDVKDVGLHVARVLSPELTPLHGDEQAPFLGGRVRDVAWRWPEVATADIDFPNPHPHPLG
jgi:ribosomal protein S12 methylthiotransferase accessory factor